MVVSVAQRKWNSTQEVAMSQLCNCLSLVLCTTQTYESTLRTSSNQNTATFNSQCYYYQKTISGWDRNSMIALSPFGWRGRHTGNQETLTICVVNATYISSIYLFSTSTIHTRFYHHLYNPKGNPLFRVCSRPQVLLSPGGLSGLTTGTTT